MSSSMLFSAQAQGRDPTTWPWAPLRVTAKVRDCRCKLAVAVHVYGRVERVGGWIGTTSSSLHLSPLVHLLLHEGLGLPGLQAQRVAHHVDAVLLAVNQWQVGCREDSNAQWHQSTSHNWANRLPVITTSMMDDNDNTTLLKLGGWEICM